MQPSGTSRMATAEECASFFTFFIAIRSSTWIWLSVAIVEPLAFFSQGQSGREASWRLVWLERSSA